VVGVLSAYGADGSALWSTPVADADTPSEVALAGIDPEGGVRLSGVIGAPGGEFPFLQVLAAFDQQGGERWQFSPSPFEEELPEGAVSDFEVRPDGGIVVAASGQDPKVYRLSADGDLEWRTDLGAYRDVGNAAGLSVAEDGQVAALTRFNGVPAYRLHVLGPDGSLRWTDEVAPEPASVRLYGVPDSDDPYEAARIALSPTLDLYAADNQEFELPVAEVRWAKLAEVVRVRRYDAAGLSLDAPSAPAPQPFRIGTVYPNPASASWGTVRVPVTLPSSGTVSVDVFDLLGRRVGSIREVPVAEGTSDLPVGVDALVPGVYTVRVTSDHGVGVRRFTKAE
jgi:hypothetical protein